MNIKFCGAAGTVTGSCHLLELDNGQKILLDCGLYQGRDEDFNTYNREWLFEPGDIDCLILSHAHIDHSGRVPKLVRDGFKGEIISTHATRDLCAIMLLDSAYIQEQDARWTKKREGREVEPLYTVEDAELALENFYSIPYNRWYKVTDAVSVIFRDAGHILGSASVTLKIKNQDGSETMVGFTGDIGRPDRPILRDPAPMPDVDYLICESTYGGEKHQDLPDDEQRFLDIINETCVKNKGKLLIPAFSVGRTQEIVYMLDRLETAGKLPHLPVYVDSPLAVNATEIFIAHPECYDTDLLKYMLEDPNPFGFNGLQYIRSVEKSKAINFQKGPAIIISASGMMSAGRIRHHIYNHIEESNSALLIVGFCAPGTLGAILGDKPASIKLFGQQLQVKAKILRMDSFSGHADQREILEYLDHLNATRVKKIFLVHGERERQYPLQTALESAGFSTVVLPELGESVQLS